MFETREGRNRVFYLTNVAWIFSIAFLWDKIVWWVYSKQLPEQGGHVFQWAGPVWTYVPKIIDKLSDHLCLIGQEPDG